MDYFRPETLSSALNWLDENQVRIAAGCTDLFPATTSNRLDGPVLDITAIDQLRGIAQEEHYWRFGATTTWTDVIRADLPSCFDSLKLAAREVGSVQIQNSGTLAGNICNASPAADGVPCWLTLDAEVELKSVAGTRRLSLGSFLIGARNTALNRNEIVSAILVPKTSSKGRSNFLKLGARKYLVISIAMIAARVTQSDGVISDAAISVGSCSEVAARLPTVEQAIIGHPLSQDTIELINGSEVEEMLAPINDIRSDADYRMEAAVELVRRCLGGLVQNEVAAA